MKLLKLVSVMIIASTTISANATSTYENKPVAVSGELGTFGYGGSIGYSVDESAEIQIGYNGGDLIELNGTEGEFKVDDVNFTADLDFKAPYLALQLRPFKNWFTVGAGVMHLADSGIYSTANPDTGVNFEWDGKEYTANSDDAQLMANINFKNPVSPYATLGFRPNINSNFGVFAEMGAAYTGGLVVDVEAQGDFKVEGQSIPATEKEAALTELEERAETEISDKIAEADGTQKFFPIFKLGATVRF